MTEPNKDTTGHTHIWRARQTRLAGFERSATLANAINRVSWWLVQELADMLEEGQVFAYLGPTDVRYVIFTVAAMKTGRIVGDIQHLL